MSAETTVPRKRRWFQIHLSTLLMLTIVAGLMMMANFTPQPAHHESYTLNKFGWPLMAAGRVAWVEEYTAVQLDLFGDVKYVKVGDGAWSMGPLLADVGIGVLVLIAAAFLFEWPIRRDAAEKSLRVKSVRVGSGRLESLKGEGGAESAVAVPAGPLPCGRGSWHVSLISKVVMAVLGLVLMAANMAPHYEKQSLLKVTTYGWPWPMLTQTTYATPEIRAEAFEFKSAGWAVKEEGWSADWAMMAADLGVGLGVLLAFLVVCEWAARGAKKGKTGRRVARNTMR